MRASSYLDEVIGVTEFMTFLLDKLPAEVYQTLLELEKVYLEQKVGEICQNLEQIEIT